LFSGAGYDQVDVHACADRGIKVSNVPTAVDDATADVNMFLILGALSALGPVSMDIYLPALVLPAALHYFLPDSMSSTLKATIDTVIFTITLIGRPIGGPIFGNLADRIGRKRVAMITGTAFTIITGLIACLPGYKEWGYVSLVLLIALRLLNGVFLGGGYAGPIPLAIERAPKRMRGLVGGISVLGAPLAETLDELKVDGDRLRYYDHELPLADGTR